MERIRKGVDCRLLLPLVAEGMPAPNVLQDEKLRLQWSNGPGSTVFGRSSL